DQALAVLAPLPAKVFNTDALPIRARCYVQLGKTNDLEALVQIAKRAVNLSPNAVINFAGILMDAGRSKTAVEILQLVLRSRPINAGTLTMLAKAELVEKDFASARRHLLSAAGLDLLSPEIAYLQAELEFEQGNVTAALPFIKKALERAPNSPDI